MLNIYLYKMGRNLNRCIRSVYSFGLTEIKTIQCDNSYLKYNLFNAKDVKIVNSELPKPEKTLVLEVNGKENLSSINFGLIENIIIGGESVNVPTQFGKYSAKIDTKNKLCLTSEAALNIVLYECFINRFNKIKNSRIVNNIIASGMLTTNDVLYLKNIYNVDTFIDLTKRNRLQIENVCNKINANYIKIPIDENEPDIKLIDEIELIHTNASVFCYRGIHRTGIVLNKYFNIPIDIKCFKNHKKLLEMAKQ